MTIPQTETPIPGQIRNLNSDRMRHRQEVIAPSARFSKGQEPIAPNTLL
jgi:hypothetical protein